MDNEPLAYMCPRCATDIGLRFDGSRGEDYTIAECAYCNTRQVVAPADAFVPRPVYEDRRDDSLDSVATGIAVLIIVAAIMIAIGALL